jgi:chromosomal replication initiation ATPase DnaA
MIFPDIGVEKIKMTKTSANPNSIFTPVNRPGRKIIEEECNHYGITLPEFLGVSKNGFFVAARWKAWFRLQTELGWSANRIAGLCNREHTTVSHGLSKYRDGQKKATA